MLYISTTVLKARGELPEKNALRDIRHRATSVLSRRACACAACQRFYKRWLTLVLLVVAVITAGVFGIGPRVAELEERLVSMEARLQYLQTLYRARLQHALVLQAKLSETKNTENYYMLQYSWLRTPEVNQIIDNNKDTLAVKGVDTTTSPVAGDLFVGQLMPHLLLRRGSLRPLYHLRGRRTRRIQLVVGILFAGELNYLESEILFTLKHLIGGMSESDKETTLIVLFIGVMDLAYVLETSLLVEKWFSGDVQSGLVEVLAPSPGYYPGGGGGGGGGEWRIRNLNIMYLMAYCQMKGDFFLLLENGVIALNNYMPEIKQYMGYTFSTTNPPWFYVEVGDEGCAGLLRGAELPRLLAFMQLFYERVPFRHLLGSFVADIICTDLKYSDDCLKKTTIVWKIHRELFKHPEGDALELEKETFAFERDKVTPMSSLRFIAHWNPQLEAGASGSTMRARSGHSLLAAYNGDTYFWAERPSKGDELVFWFKKPTIIKSIFIRSGALLDRSDQLYHAVVEVLPERTGAGAVAAFAPAAAFDEHGLAAAGTVLADKGPLNAIRVRLTDDNPTDVIISEINIEAYT